MTESIILSISSCRANLSAIQSTLEEVPPQDPNKLMERLNDLASLLGTSSQLMASYQFHVDGNRLIAVQEAHKNGYKGNMCKDYVEGRCAEIRAEFRMAERQNACITHSIDAARSILSYLKQENFTANLQRG